MAEAQNTYLGKNIMTNVGVYVLLCPFNCKYRAVINIRKTEWFGFDHNCADYL